MSCSARYMPHRVVPGHRCDTYVCHVCGREVDRYQLREQPDGKARRIDVSADPCGKCLARFNDNRVSK